MNRSDNPNLPIGYWIKQVDNWLTRKIDQVQAANGVTRSEWQVLNTLSEYPSLSREKLLDILSAFLDKSQLDEILAAFFQRGWLSEMKESGGGVDELILTDEGRRQHTIILSTQREIRQTAMQGITTDEYETAVRVLQRMAANLENAPAAPNEEDQSTESQTL